MKIVLDSNIFISAFLFKGIAAQIFDYCSINSENFISNFILSELRRIFIHKFNIQSEIIIEMEDLILSKFNLIQPQNKIPVLCRDEKDNQILQ